ncbi:MAG: bifunctional oligoribonuclease/PAP phosphatase NrnA, partial [Christensenellaceae bacterium]|nr:bifunctional oligoribonuclease/PAP phosphatase NrnA [Christensenellaceae bacterium]
MYENFIKKVGSADTISIFMHINPDGDCVGSSLALYAYLKNMGKRVNCFLEPGHVIGDNLQFLPNIKEFNRTELKHYDLAIAVDCGDANRLGLKCYDLFCKSDEKLVIDHHYNNSKFTDDVILESHAAATTEILYKIFNANDASYIDIDVATCLFTGLVTDTGAFVFSSTTKQTFATAAALSGYGLDTYSIIRRVLSEYSIEAFHLKNRVLSRAEFLFDNKVAIITFSSEDFEATNTTELDTKPIIGNILNISSVLLAVSISFSTRTTDYKVSFRSKDKIN